VWEEIEADLRRRDERDRSRAVAPLAKPADAVEIDTTRLTVEEVVERVLSRIRATGGKGPSPAAPRSI